MFATVTNVIEIHVMKRTVATGIRDTVLLKKVSVTPEAYVGILWSLGQWRESSWCLVRQEELLEANVCQDLIHLATSTFLSNPVLCFDVLGRGKLLLALARMVPWYPFLTMKSSPYLQTFSVRVSVRHVSKSLTLWAMLAGYVRQHRSPLCHF
jgi:hypothetical protein